jgi:glucose-1-phosphatase
MKTIFVDFGNVIGFFDHQRAVRQLVDYTPLSAAILTPLLYGSQIEEDYELGKLSSEQYVQAAKEQGQLRCDPTTFLTAFVDIFTPNDEVCELIPRLAKRYRLVLASNTNAAHYEKYTHQFADVLRHFSALCPSHLVGWRKPNLHYFIQCQLEAQALPSECLFLDDMSVNVDAARVHGWNALLYQPGNDLANQLHKLGLEWN